MSDPDSPKTAATATIDDGAPSTLAATGEAGPEWAPNAAPEASPDALIGQTLDRYEVTALLGAGGMGVVYAARDLALDRKVALKLLPPLAPERRVHLEARLLREALALARLDHPNVVAVHDVGVAAQSVFIAMQLVDGATLERHLADSRPPPRRILELFLAAARGLAAAHAAGIVHRDFKPANVLVRHDGQVFVGDFGLAFGAGDRDEAAAAEPSLLHDRFTRAGALVGTLPYMAPEQHRRESATARSDQFGFCVALWEALFGVHPFAGGPWKTAEAVAAMEDDAVVEPPRRRELPPRLVRALRRGLRRAPAERWPSMEALAAELEPPREGRARWWIAGGIGVAVAAAAVAFAVREGHRRDPALCSGAEVRLAGAWDDAIRARSEQAFRASGRPYAADAFARAAARLDRYADRWAERRTDACAATRIRGEQSEALLDRRMACFDRRRDELGALAALFAGGDASVVDSAVDAATRLTPLDSCDDVEGLTAAPPRPTGLSQAMPLAFLEARMAQTIASRAAGRYPEALAMVRPLVPAARRLGYAPLVAEALHLESTLESNAGVPREALDTGYEAVVAAAVAGDPVREAEVLIGLIPAAAEIDRYDEAIAFDHLAEAAIARQRGAPSTRDELRAGLLVERGTLQYRRGDPAAARGALEEAIAAGERLGDRLVVARASNMLGAALGGLGDWSGARQRYQAGLAIFREEYGPSHPETLRVQGNLGTALYMLGDLAAAASTWRTLLPLLEQLLGADSPEVARTAANLALVMRKVGYRDEAKALLRRALAIDEKVYGRDSSEAATNLLNLGDILVAEQSYAEAQALLERALAIRIAAHGETNPTVANVRRALGGLLDERGDLVGARRQYDQALATIEQALGPDHERAGELHGDIGDLYRRRGGCKAAIARYERQLAIVEKTYGADHPALMGPLNRLGSCANDLGQHDAALRWLERSVAIAERSQAGPCEIGLAHFGLAQALWDGGRDPAADRARARRLVAQARTELEAGGVAGDVAALDAWAAAHPD